MSWLDDIEGGNPYEIELETGWSADDFVDPDEESPFVVHGSPFIGGGAEVDRPLRDWLEMTFKDFDIN